MSPTSDDGAIFTARQTGTSNITFITKVNEFGEVIWCKKLSLLGSFTTVSGPKETMDGNFIVPLTTLTPQVSSSAVLVKMNEFGDTLWSRRYTDQFSLVEYSKVIETNDTCYVLFWGGFGGGLINVVKIDSDGNTLWTKKIFGTLWGTYNASPTIEAALPLSDNSILLSGLLSISTLGPVSSTASFVLKIDHLGNILWYNRYPDAHFFESLYAHGNEFRSIYRSINNAGVKFSKFDSLGLNYETFHDASFGSLGGFEYQNLSWSNQVNDSVYHIIFDNPTDTGQILTIDENINILQAQLSNFSNESTSHLLDNGRQFQFGSQIENNVHQLRLVASTANNLACPQTNLSVNFAPSSTLTSSPLVFQIADLIELKAQITISDYNLSSYEDCEIQLSLAENSSQIFQLFPNPSSDFIQLTTDFKGKYNLTIYNFQGQIIQEYSNQIGHQSFEISELSSGFYNLSIQIEEGDSQHFKICVVH